MSSLTRRRLLQGGAIVAGTAALAIAEDGTIFEPNHVSLVRMEMVLPRLPAAFDGFTIAQLSDFHYDEFFCVVPIRAAVDLVNTLHADLIVLTGDFVTTSVLKDYLHNAKEAVSAAEPCAKILAQMQARLGTVAIMGNHDVAADPVKITEIVQAYGIRVLRNTTMPIEQEGARLWLCGLDSAWEGKPEIERTLSPVPRDEAVILLVHEPDFADSAVKYPVDLQLSGHSHGGQVWLPGIGAPWLPDMAQKYPRGLYHVGRLILYTNLGLGTIRVPVRLNCPPEVTLITLRAGGKRTESRAGRD